MNDFKGSLIFTAVCVLIAFLLGGLPAAAIAVLLGMLEVSLSFDNAVVNASILQGMEEKWRRRFLTWGMLIAVFGMRALFPVVIVAMAAGLGMGDVVTMALQRPDEYARHLQEAHVVISAFGATFLGLVFLHYFTNSTKEVHWLGPIEEKLAAIGKLDMAQVLIAGFGLLAFVNYLVPQHERYEALVAGVVGILTYTLIDSLKSLAGDPGDALANTAKNAGLMSFLYLEVLDASFSLDGVIGAFAVTKSVLIITLGLAIGAMFVRSMTIALVKNGTLAEYRYLENGAYWGIGSLATLMLVSINTPIPEVVTGLIGVGFIGAALASSIYHNRQEADGAPPESPPTAA